MATEKSICSRCGGSDISLDTSTYKSFAMAAPSLFKCNDCGLTSATFPTIDGEENEDNEILSEALQGELDDDTTERDGPPTWFYIVALIFPLLWPFIVYKVIRKRLEH